MLDRTTGHLAEARGPCTHDESALSILRSVAKYLTRAAANSASTWLHAAGACCTGDPPFRDVALCSSLRPRWSQQVVFIPSSGSIAQVKVPYHHACRQICTRLWSSLLYACVL